MRGVEESKWRPGLVLGSIERETRPCFEGEGKAFGVLSMSFIIHYLLICYLVLFASGVMGLGGGGVVGNWVFRMPGGV